MSYGNFVGQLSKGIEGYIVAYDIEEERGGCVLYLRKRPCTIFVSAAIIDQRWAEAIQALRERIRASEWDEHHLMLVNDQGLLVFKTSLGSRESVG